MAKGDVEAWTKLLSSRRFQIETAKDFSDMAAMGHDPEAFWKSLKDDAERDADLKFFPYRLESRLRDYCSNAIAEGAGESNAEAPKVANGKRKRTIDPSF